MDKKMIEELTNKICSVLFIKSSQPNCGDCYFNDGCEYKVLAEELLKYYQPKNPEGAVVLTKEELERIKGFSREEVDEISETAIKNSRKETAEKFAREFIHDILPKIMNGHKEKGLQIAMAMTNLLQENYGGEL